MPKFEIINNYLKKSIRSVYLCLLGFATAYVLYIAFPPRIWLITAWVALVPFLLTLYRANFRDAVLLSLSGGLSFYFMITHWLNHFHPWSIYFTVPYYGLLYFTIPMLGIYLLKKYNRIIFIFLSPAIWVLAEYLKCNGFFSMPTGNLFMTQVRWLNVIQFADITGAWGISYLVFLSNLIIADLIENLFIHRKKYFQSRAYIPQIIFVVIFSVLILYGKVKIRSVHWGEVVKLAVVQTAHLPREIWQTNYERYFGEYEKQIQKSLFLKPKLIVFPEGTIKTFVNLKNNGNSKEAVEYMNHISGLAKKYEVSIIVGGLEVDKTTGIDKKFNSIFYFDAKGNLSGLYRKRKLVSFGETAPLDWLSPAIQNRINRDSRTIMFQAGDSPGIFPVPFQENMLKKAGILVCFESTYPNLSREYARDGIDFLINLSSDYWSQSLEGMYQHAVFSVFRAVENRVPVVRATNGGVSMYINPFGRMYTNLKIGELASMPFQMQFIKGSESFYTRHGDWFILVCLFALLACVSFYARSQCRRRVLLSGDD